MLCSLVQLDIKKKWIGRLLWTESREPRDGLQSTKEMTFPVRPPTFLSDWATPDRAGPAAEETRERPSEALEAADWAASPAFSEVEEACLTAVLRTRNCDCRSTARDAVAGILRPLKNGKGWKEGNESRDRTRESNRRLVKSRGHRVVAQLQRDAFDWDRIWFRELQGMAHQVIRSRGKDLLTRHFLTYRPTVCSLFTLPLIERTFILSNGLVVIRLISLIFTLQSKIFSQYIIS